MRQLYSDPDFTGGYTIPGVAAFWQFTRDQWYVVCRVLYREHIRGHMSRDPSGITDPDTTEIAWIHQRVKQLLLGMVNDPTQTWNRIQWGARIPWNKVACYGYWSGSGGDVFMSFQQWSGLYGSCGNEIVYDASYQSGLAALNAPLDSVEPWGDIYHQDIYEAECDAIYNEALGSMGLTSGVPSIGSAPGAGGGWSTLVAGGDTSKSTDTSEESKSGGVGAGAVIATVLAVVAIGGLGWLGYRWLA